MPMKVSEVIKLPDRVRPLLAWIVGPAADKTAALGILAVVGRAVAYVGDIEHDIASAKAAGLLAIATTGGYTSADRLRRSNPDLVIDDLATLIPLLTARTKNASAAKHPDQAR